MRLSVILSTYLSVFVSQYYVYPVVMIDSIGYLFIFGKSYETCHINRWVIFHTKSKDKNIFFICFVKKTKPIFKISMTILITVKKLNVVMWKKNQAYKLLLLLY